MCAPQLEGERGLRVSCSHGGGWWGWSRGHSLGTWERSLGRIQRRRAEEARWLQGASPAHAPGQACTVEGGGRRAWGRTEMSSGCPLVVAQARRG